MSVSVSVCVFSEKHSPAHKTNPERKAGVSQAGSAAASSAKAASGLRRLGPSFDRTS